MQYKNLPRTELNVSRVCLGTMTWGEQNTEAQAHEQLRAGEVLVLHGGLRYGRETRRVAENGVTVVTVVTVANSFLAPGFLVRGALSLTLKLLLPRYDRHGISVTASRCRRTAT